MRFDRRLTTFAFLNLGHAYDHLFILLYPTVVLALGDVFQASYGELLALSVYGFIAFGAGALPAGWLGDRWSRRGMMIVFFVGIGLASIRTGLARSTVDIAVGLGLVGLFASIYQPVGIAMVAETDPARVGKALGLNGVFGNLGVAFAGVTAGALTDMISWRAAFIVPGVVAVATFFGDAAVDPLGVADDAGAPDLDVELLDPAIVAGPVGQQMGAPGRPHAPEVVGIWEAALLGQRQVPVGALDVVGHVELTIDQHRAGVGLVELVGQPVGHAVRGAPAQDETDELGQGQRPLDQRRQLFALGHVFPVARGGSPPPAGG